MRRVLTGILLALAATLISPLAQPKSIELLCAGTGSVKLLVGGADDADRNISMAPDCALCAQASLPPPNHQIPVAAPQRMALVQHTAQPPREALRAAPPLPARGPPSMQRV